MRTRLAFLMAAISLVGCQLEREHATADRAALQNVLSGARSVAGNRMQPGRMIAALGGGDAELAPTDESVVGKTFEIDPDTSCMFVSDDPRPDGSDVVASCNGGELTIALTLTRTDGRTRAGIHIDGILRGHFASLEGSYDLADTAGVIDGSFEEDVTVLITAAGRGRRHSIYAFEEVRLDSAGCAVAGAIEAEVTETLPSGKTITQARFVLGPRCGDLHREP